MLFIYLFVFFFLLLLLLRETFFAVSPDELFAFSIIRYHLFLSVVKWERFYHVPINRLVRLQNQRNISSTSTRKCFNVCISLVFSSLTLNLFMYTFSFYVFIKIIAMQLVSLHSNVLIWDHADQFVELSSTKCQFHSVAHEQMFFALWNQAKYHFSSLLILFWHISCHSHHETL